MTTIQTIHPLPTSSHRLIPALAVLLALAAVNPPLASAQSAPASFASTAMATTQTILSLPDAPGMSTSPSAPLSPSPFAAAAADADGTQPALATRKDKYILPGQTAPPITAGDKFYLGVKDAVSPLAIIGWLSSAGYSQLIDNSPNYGTDRGAFGQRLGAAALRATSENILGDSIMSPLFHEDPRYYKLGHGHNFFHRLVYSSTRAVITRTDHGHSAFNFGQVSGNLEGAILTNVYYPSRNRTAKDTAQTFAGSVGGSALAFVVSEFLSDTLEFVHLKDSD